MESSIQVTVDKSIWQFMKDSMKPSHYYENSVPPCLTVGKILFEEKNMNSAVDTSWELKISRKKILFLD